MRLDRKHEAIRSLGIWTWLAIVEQEADHLSEGAQNALGLLREDLERLVTTTEDNADGE